MKKKLLFIFGLLICFNLGTLNIHAEAPKLSQPCNQKIKWRNEQFTSQIMKDIISNFNLEIDEDGYAEVTSGDLDAANIIYGGKEKDTYYDSLKQQFYVESFGGPRLFIKPLEAYVLYKQLDHTDVMVHLKLNNSKWEVIDTKKKSGNKIEFKRLKCENKYLREKKEFYSH